MAVALKKNMDNQSKGNIIIYQTDDGLTKVDVKFENETVWLTQEQMAELFQRDKSVISRHIKNIFEEGELLKEAVVANFATTAVDGKTYQVDYYNLDVIISTGYRVKSIRGTQFRQWATGRLREYMIKGFSLDDRRLKGNGGGAYWKELLDRILSSGGRQLLADSGNVSHSAALEKAESEYTKYIRNNLSPVEEAYLQTINEAAKIAKKKSKE